MKIRPEARWFSSAVFLLALALHAPAQEISATILGVVSDRSGAVVAGAVIQVLDADRQIVRRTLRTSSAGQYSAPLLPIGYYRVTAEAPGFKKDERAGIKLNVNDHWVVNFVLQVGAVDELVKVEADPLQVDLKTPAASGVISGTQIRELPLNTRNYALLVALQPGVSPNLASDQLYVGLSGPNGSQNALNFSINGARADQNNWTLDGADNLDRGSNLTLLTYPSVESIEEFRLLRGNYSPEFSSGSSGQVIAMTRSGTSQFHGSAYEFFRNDVLAANNFFNNRYQLPRPPIRYNNFGFTIGGPLYIPGVYNRSKNKTFFFYSEEWRRVIDYSTLISGTMPTLAEQQGTFGSPVCTEPIFDPKTGACIGPTTTQITNFDPTAAAYIKDIFSKLPAPGVDGNIAATARNRYDFRGETVRVDHIFSPTLSIFGRFINNDIPTVEPSGLFAPLPLPGVATTSTNAPGRGLAVRATLTLTPTLLNEIGYAYSYGAVITNPIGLASTQISPDIRPVLPFASTLNRVPDLSFFAGQSMYGFGRFLDYNRNHAVLDTMTKVAGKHTFKGGFTYNHYEKEENLAHDTNGAYSFYGTDPAGQYTFQQEWASFLLGNVANFSQISPGPSADIRQNVFEWFVQDEFRVRPNLTLSLGFRWSFFRQPTDGNGHANSFDPEAFDPAAAPAIDITTGLLVSGTATPVVDGLVTNQTSRYGSSLYRQSNWNIAPRVGLAWDPFGKGKTAIRAGYGIFFDNPSKFPHETAIFFNPPLVRSVNINNTNLSDPGSVVSDTNLIPSGIGGVALNWIQPYSEHWSMDVQQQIGPSTVVSIGYYGDRSIHLPGGMDINQPRPGAYLDAGVLPGGPINPGNTQLLNYVRPYPGYSTINMQYNRFGSNYNSLQAQLQRRIHNNSSFTVNYTLSHALTNADNTFFSFPQNIYDVSAEYADSSFDRRHIFTASYVYALPFSLTQHGLAGHLAGGWELSGVVYAESGVPVTVAGTDIDPAGLGFFIAPYFTTPRPDQHGDPNRHAPHTIDSWFDTSVFAAPPADGIKPGSARPWSVRGPGVVRLDAAVTKNTRIGEHIALQFRAEATNALNHTNFDGVNGWFLDQDNFGKVGSARDSRIVQLGLKLTF